MRLSGLEPHTAYHYRVRSRAADGQSVASETYTFRTAIDPQAPLAFAVIGDSRTYPKVYRRVCEAVWQQRPDIVLHVGDIVSDGTVKRQWVFECFRPAQELMSRVALIPSLGNHERDAHWWYDYFALPEPEYYFDFTYGNAQFFAVDTDRDLKPDSDQIRWLRRRLAASKATWKFVYHHHPPFSADSNDYGDTAKGDSVWGDLKVRRALVPLYERYGVDIVFDGHIHLYERTWPLRAGRADPERGVIYVTVGGGGAELEELAPFRPWFINTVRRNYHFAYVTICGKTLQYRAYDDQGRLFDCFELHKQAVRR